MTRIAVLLIVLSLAACGTKGSLELPPGPAPEPLFGSGKTASLDVSTPTRTKNQ
ncbi:MAG: lipoprotein [Dechloromonas sp.]|nr:MAG: lipoprotein [Dechloromonas sp.]